MTHPSNNRLQYSGSKTRSFIVTGSMSVTQSNNNRYFSFYLAKNGTIIPESRQDIKVVNSTDQVSLTITSRVTLAPGDYVEVWVANQTSTTDITVQTMNLSMH